MLITQMLSENARMYGTEIALVERAPAPASKQSPSESKQR